MAALHARPPVGRHLDARHHRRLAGRRARHRRRAGRDHRSGCRSTATATGSAAPSPGSAGRRCWARSRCSAFALVHGAVFLALKTDGAVRLRRPARSPCAGRRSPRCRCCCGPGWCSSATGTPATAVLWLVAALAVLVAWARIRVDREGQAFAAWAVVLLGSAATVFGAAYPVVVPSTIDPRLRRDRRRRLGQRLHAHRDDLGRRRRAARRARLPGLDLLGVPQAAPAEPETPHADRPPMTVPEGHVAPNGRAGRWGRWPGCRG